MSTHTCLFLIDDVSSFTVFGVDFKKEKIKSEHEGK